MKASRDAVGGHFADVPSRPGRMVGAALAVGAVWTGLLLRRYGAGSASSAHSGSH